jgi:hypothetical protein
MHLMGSSCKLPAHGLWTSTLASLIDQSHSQATRAFARVCCNS